MGWSSGQGALSLSSLFGSEPSSHISCARHSPLLQNGALFLWGNFLRLLSCVESSSSPRHLHFGEYRS